jgi:hypothetical protein
MWPELFGAGSELGLLVAGAILAAFGAFVWFAMRTARPLGPDPLADLWRRYEQGDLTSWEAARQFRILAAQKALAERVASLPPSSVWRGEAEGTGWGLASARLTELVQADRVRYRPRAR